MENLILAEPPSSFQEGKMIAKKMLYLHIMQKIAIIGAGGAGKSTLTRQLGEILSLPVYHLDALYWKPNWTPTPLEDWEAIQETLVQQDAWILDGNYSNTLRIRFQAADTIIFLDYPGWLCLWRVLQRRWKYLGKTRPDMGKGCPEKIDAEFLYWVWNYRRTRRPGILQRLAAYKTSKTVFIFTSPTQTKRFIKQLKPSMNP